MDLADLLIDTLKKGASDLHLTVGAPPTQRIHGAITPMPDLPILTRDTLHNLLYDMLTDDQRRRFEGTLELDFALELGKDARFRVNVFMGRQGEGAVFRVIPTKILTLDDLKMPHVLKELCRKPRGIILVTGPTGSGKSTTLSAMVDFVNTSRAEHILTIEDPIEFVHEHKKCIVNQREVGPNTKSFSNALRAALREDPDIILVGEMRDLETIQLALTAAETGHLVFATLHTSSAPKTIDRLIDVFPPEQQKQVRIMFSESVQAVICQTLIPRIDRPGRICAMEIMVGTVAIRSLIREAKTHQIPSIIQTSAKYGMQSLDQELKRLVLERIISKQDALERANNKELFSDGEGAGGAPSAPSAAPQMSLPPRAPAMAGGAPGLPPRAAAAAGAGGDDSWKNMFGGKR